MVLFYSLDGKSEKKCSLKDFEEERRERKKFPFMIMKCEHVECEVERHKKDLSLFPREDQKRMPAHKKKFIRNPNQRMGFYYWERTNFPT